MTDQPLIHDDRDPDGRPATEHELADILGGMTTADGTNLHDLWRETEEN